MSITVINSFLCSLKITTVLLSVSLLLLVPVLVDVGDVEAEQAL